MPPTAHHHLPAKMPNCVPQGSRFVCRLTVLIGMAAIVAASGCADPLLAPDEPRSQYDRYDAVRDQRAATTYTDEFGFKRPNIRGRLLPKE